MVIVLMCSPPRLRQRKRDTERERERDFEKDFCGEEVVVVEVVKAEEKRSVERDREERASPTMHEKQEKS